MGFLSTVAQSRPWKYSTPSPFDPPAPPNLTVSPDHPFPLQTLIVCIRVLDGHPMPPLWTDTPWPKSRDLPVHRQLIGAQSRSRLLYLFSKLPPHNAPAHREPHLGLQLILILAMLAHFPVLWSDTLAKGLCPPCPHLHLHRSNTTRQAARAP